MKPKKKSIAALCTIHIVVYACVLALLYGYVSVYNTSRFDKTFPSMEMVLSHIDAFREGNYDLPRLKNASYIVYDNASKIKEYESVEGLDLTYRDLEFINSYDSTAFYDVAYQIQNEKTHYIISYRVYNDEKNISHVLSTCTLDEYLNITDGTLFPTRKGLTQKELQLLQGNYYDSSIMKYKFNDVHGQSKTVVFIAQKFTYASYDALVKGNYKTMMLIVPLAFAVLLLQIYLFKKALNKGFAPFTKAIHAYRRHEDASVSKDDIPKELRPTVKEFKSLVDKLEETKQQRDLIQQDRQRIITNISHDLKTPLTVIRGYSSALLDHSVDEETKHKYLQTINQRAVVANELINSLFEYVKIDHPDYKINKEVVNLSEVMLQYFAGRYNEIEEKGFFLEVDIDESIYASLDVQLMTRVFDNLVDNCLKYNKKETTLFVSLKDEQDIHITIADNGVGISQDIKGTLFEPFVIGNTARTENKGTGIGLSFVERTMELHGGSISLSSDDAYITQFHIRLPKQG